MRLQRNVTGNPALHLGHWFGTSAQFWRNLQSAYGIRVAELAAGAEITALSTLPARAVEPPNS